MDADPGALLVLTKLRETDRTGHIYGRPDRPDEPIDPSGASANDPDPLLTAATRWLQQQPEGAH